MKLNPPSLTLSKVKRGYALIMVMLLTAASLTVLSSALSWTSNLALQSSRALQFGNGAAAAEAAVERVAGRMSLDHFEAGEDEVDDQVSNYRKMVPTANESKVWADYQFMNLSDTKNRITVNKLSYWNYRMVPGKYEGLSGYSTTYEIGCQARALNVDASEMVSARQELAIVSIPLSSFQVFYFMDLEICPSAAMTFNGPVHANGNIYIEPQGEVTFLKDVTATGRILHQNHPLDPVGRKPGKITYKGEADAGVNTLSLPLGTNNSLNTLRAIVEVPPTSESATSVLGSQRFYNQAQLVILVYNDKVVVTSGRYNSFKTKVTYLESTDVLDVSKQMFDKRQNKNVLLSEIDVAKLVANFSNLAWTLGRSPRIIYLADLRTANSVQFPAVRLVNGQSLPDGGVTIVTPNPIYVKGHYNVVSGYEGTTNTNYSRQAALIADAITILSSEWDDKNDGKSIKHRMAKDVTVNAAILAGIVPTKAGYYSGGVENYFRHLEDWSEATFTFNGSITALFDSRVATAPWGATADIYETPQKRAWTYDHHLQEEDRLPHGMPCLRSCIRGQMHVKLTDGTNRKL
jgi:hypothetical protein